MSPRSRAPAGVSRTSAISRAQVLVEGLARRRRSGGFDRVMRAIQESFEQHSRRGRPPLVHGRSADAGACRDRVHARPGCALQRQVGCGIENRASRVLAAGSPASGRWLRITEHDVQYMSSIIRRQDTCEESHDRFVEHPHHRDPSGGPRHRNHGGGDGPRAQQRRVPRDGVESHPRKDEAARGCRRTGGIRPGRRGTRRRRRPHDAVRFGCRARRRRGVPPRNASRRHLDAEQHDRPRRDVGGRGRGIRTSHRGRRHARPRHQRPRRARGTDRARLGRSGQPSPPSSRSSTRSGPRRSWWAIGWARHPISNSSAIPGSGASPQAPHNPSPSPAAFGLDPALFLEAISGSASDSPYAHLKGAELLEGVRAPQFALDGLLKDLRLTRAAVGASRTTAYLDGLEAVYAEASAAGHGHEDVAWVYDAIAS